MSVMASPRTLADYAERLERVLAYLAENLDREVDLDRLAEVACFSPFHFHRVYHALQGETVAETVRRMRLHRAAVDLIDGEVPIPRIAARAGYGSQAAFTRAFRSAYGAPPGAYRSVAAAAPAEPPAVELRATPRLRMLALRHHGDYAGIGGAFERLRAAAAGRGLLGPASRFFGIYYADPSAVPEADLVSEACLVVADQVAAEGELHILEIAAGRHAVLRHVGPYAELHRPYTWLYREWLPRSGQEAADRPCLEEYLNDPRLVPPPELRTEIWLPLAE
jgi:AraC family transcriptional regulator